jgi:hypothetical protein
VSPLESLLCLRERFNVEIDRALTAMKSQPKECGDTDLRGARNSLLHLYEVFNARGDRVKAEDCIRVAQYITAELR